jgi:RND superfamily putative drug exporter
MSKRNSMATLTRWVLSHKKLVVGLWVALALAGIGAAGPADNAFNDQFTVPGQEAFAANSEIVKTYGNGGDVAPLVPVVSLPEGKTIDSAGVQADLARALAKIKTALPDARVASYASTRDRTFVSQDGRTTFALVYIPALGMEPGQAEARRAQAALQGVTVGGATVEVTGVDALRAAATEGGEAGGASFAVEAAIAGGGALLVLAFVFASLMAIVPLLMAVVAIPTTFLLVWPLASATDVSVIVKFLIALVGLAIAIDYALLIVVRWREERQRGHTSNEDAVVKAMQHAGKAVVFSGTTVAISLLALVVLPVPFLRSIGIAGMLIPLVSVAVAVTLLPVVLATLGPRLDRRHTRRADHPSRGWTSWARFIVRRRWTAAIVSTAALGALVLAASSIQLGAPRADSLAQSGPARAGLEQLERSGIGTGPLSPFDALVRAGDPDRVADGLARVEGVSGTVAPPAWRQGGSALVTVIPTVEGNSPAGRETLDRIRRTSGAMRTPTS